jgi:hypothetical protein
MKIAVGNMSPVFPQMQGDPVGPPHFRKRCRPNGVWLVGLTRLPHRGDVVDIYAQFRHDRKLPLSNIQNK